MKKKKWTFLSNHGHVFAYIAEHPQSTTQYIAHKADLSIRAVQNILDDLEEEGYITREKVGRANRYIIIAGKPMRHRLERKHSINKVLQALGMELRIV